jgi:hypothetical protein
MSAKWRHVTLLRQVQSCNPPTWVAGAVHGTLAGGDVRGSAWRARHIVSSWRHYGDRFHAVVHHSALQNDCPDPPTFYCTHGPTVGRGGQSFCNALCDMANPRFPNKATDLEMIRAMLASGLCPPLQKKKKTQPSM